MLEWLLTESNLFYTIIGITLGSIILFGIILNKLPSKYIITSGILALAIYLVPLFTIFGGIYFNSKITTKYVSDSEWKEVYTNQINVNVTLKIKHCRACRYLNLTGGSKIKDHYKDYTNSMFGKIKAEKDDLTEEKTIHIDKDDIVQENDVTSTSKLSKIEYKPATGMYKEIFGHRGKIEKSDKDGMVRITISDDKNEEREQLKSLFSGN